MGNQVRLDTKIEILVSKYELAKQIVIEAGYDSELDWQNSVDFNEITESYFLREAAWVILSSGMREVIIRRKFSEISLAFCDWESSKKICHQNNKCRNNALRCFNHPKKIEAILQIATHVFRTGFHSVCKSIQTEGIEYIMQFPYMGPATSYHFAKNLGMPVVKPDRHLCRLAVKLGYRSPRLMCSDIADAVGDKIAVVDLVLWRYATLNGSYLELFSLNDDLLSAPPKEK